MAFWSRADVYERFMGRWSRQVAPDFVSWLALDEGLRWVDVGCGTGVLTAAVLSTAAPASVVGVDPSAAFLDGARTRVDDQRVAFAVGGASEIPLPDDSVDVAVSGLVLNHVPDAGSALREMQRVVAAGGTVAAYVWDYADGMQMLRRFWDAAKALDPEVREQEGASLDVCRPEPLAGVAESSGLRDVAVGAFEVPMVFADFNDYWTPFLSGGAPAPAYLEALPADRRDALREQLRTTLPTDDDGTVRLTARAWAVRGAVA